LLDVAAVRLAPVTGAWTPFVPEVQSVSHLIAHIRRRVVLALAGAPGSMTTRAAPKTVGDQPLVVAGRFDVDMLTAPAWKVVDANAAAEFARMR
jgi:hypothetical protein